MAGSIVFGDSDVDRIVLGGPTASTSSALTSYQSAVASGYAWTEGDFYQSLAKVDQPFHQLPPLP